MWTPMQTLIYSDNQTYYGQTAVALTGVVVPHGYGIMANENGNFYRGNFVQNRRHGWGQHYNAAFRRSYYGEFVDDREEGYAIVSRVGDHGEQRVYEGYIFNSQRHGQGKQAETRADGTSTVFEGTWQSDTLSGWGKHSITTQTYSHCYEGTFANGRLEGNGYVTDLTTGYRWSVWYSGGNVTQWF